MCPINFKGRDESPSPFKASTSSDKPKRAPRADHAKKRAARIEDLAQEAAGRLDHFRAVIEGTLAEALEIVQLQQMALKDTMRSADENITGITSIQRGIQTYIGTLRMVNSIGNLAVTLGKAEQKAANARGALDPLRAELRSPGNR